MKYFTNIYELYYKVISKNRIIIMNINGSKMCLNLTDKGISRDLFLYGKREPISTDYLTKFKVLQIGDVVLDIGSNIGYYVLLESTLVGSSGIVYAIEPVSNTIKYLKTNIEINNYKNVEIFRFAAGCTNGKSEIYISDYSNLSQMEKHPAGKTVNIEEVTVVTVDSFLKDKKNPNLIRMDVEGYEYQILKGMKQTLKENIKIFMEIHPRYLSNKQLEEIFQILKKNNFKVQFATFDFKVNYHKFVKYIIRKSGFNLPLVFSNITIDELIKIIQDNINLSYDYAPHVLFSKIEL